MFKETTLFVATESVVSLKLVVGLEGAEGDNSFLCFLHVTDMVSKSFSCDVNFLAATVYVIGNADTRYGFRYW